VHGSPVRPFHLPSTSAEKEKASAQGLVRSQWHPAKVRYFDCLPLQEEEESSISSSRELILDKFEELSAHTGTGIWFIVGQSFG